MQNLLPATGESSFLRPECSGKVVFRIVMQRYWSRASSILLVAGARGKAMRAMKSAWTTRVGPDTQPHRVQPRKFGGAITTESPDTGGAFPRIEDK